VLYVTSTKGSSTTTEIVVEFSPDGATWYQETDETNSVTSNVDTRAVNAVVHQISVDGNYRFAIPVADFWFRVKAKVTGTVTSSSIAIEATLGKTYS
jgi:hypothetical protein